jgi:lysophospholipase L1-like esterase
MDMIMLGSRWNYYKRVRAIPGLVGLWPMGDGGATFQDIGPNGFTGTFSGTISAKSQAWAGGQYAQFAQGFGSVYSAGFLAAHNPSEFTLNAWVNPADWTTAANQYLAHFEADASNLWRLFMGSSGYISAGWYGGGTGSAVSLGCESWPAASFQMLTMSVSKSGNQLKLYVNGEDNSILQTTLGGTWAGAIASNYCGFGGYRPTTHVFGLYGGLSDVVLWNRALSAAEVKSLLLKPLPVLTAIGDSCLQYAARSSWIQAIAQTLGYRVQNHGWSGSAIMGAGGHHQTAQAVEAANDDASIIILQHGINDPDDPGITATYGANIAALKLSNRAARIFGMGILPNLGANSAARTANNARISTACSNQGIPYWDTDGLYDPTAGVGTSDGIHPNDAGARAIRDFVLART